MVPLVCHMERIEMIYCIPYQCIICIICTHVILLCVIHIYEIYQQLGYSDEAKVEKAVEYDKAKEKEGYIAGKHIDGRMKWWFQR